ncbi:NYN domain-containing protein [Xanthomonas massiliensis]|jgi:uncharacterized LabA/DUF88 family protein|uniref:NYN domain-containing protein n=1 Tax=Xanthomonas massiliensis TaxID=1720302 RepID=UPI0008254ED0|nr:NYN domain-containing protein [Xanthomonas massiliensis]
MANDSTDKLAVLVDADNAQPSIAAELLAEIAKYGTATIKRAYGDWTTPNLGGWKETLHDLAIQPVQQFRYTVGKNATDSALIIDAMDLLHGGQVDGFCLVSSDSDFTRLATRIRESGRSVYGFGERKTPKPFVAACDRFIYTEILRERPEGASGTGPAVATAEPAGTRPLRSLLATAVDATARDDGWAPLSAVGALLTKADSAFDPRNYGFRKLGDLVRAQPYLEVKSVPYGDGSPNANLFIRQRQK